MSRDVIKGTFWFLTLAILSVFQCRRDILTKLRAPSIRLKILVWISENFQWRMEHNFRNIWKRGKTREVFWNLRKFLTRNSYSIWFSSRNSENFQFQKFKYFSFSGNFLSKISVPFVFVLKLSEFLVEWKASYISMSTFLTFSCRNCEWLKQNVTTMCYDILLRQSWFAHWKRV